LGARGRQLSAVGVGTWALGGPFTFDGRDAGWGEVDDAESIRALHLAMEAGMTLIDTAPAYGTGHSELVIGRALAALPATVRESVAVATKFGLRIDESRRTGGGTDVRPEAIRAECDASLRRLGLDAVDLYQLHGGAETVAAAEDVVATCEELLDAGKIRSFGTAQDDAETVAVFARSESCVSVQTQVNVFGWTQGTLDAGHAHGWAVLARSPLAMGMLSGKYNATNCPKAGDVRLNTPYWDYFDADTMPGWLQRLHTVRELLTVGGRTMVQGALGYLLALDPSIIPLPGIRTEQQARENASVLALGPLPQAETAEITALLADSPERR
jgi:aryl-alcohol dehydrogenase-like predicted oxidoreductase